MSQTFGPFSDVQLGDLERLGNVATDYRRYAFLSRLLH